jgi:hypothetical protein
MSTKQKIAERRELESLACRGLTNEELLGGVVAKRVADDLAYAAKRLLLYAEIHEQHWPQWNGNRFDDQQLAKGVLSAYESAPSTQKYQDDSFISRSEA